MARVAIPKSVRFEVFKRDRFTCQYCGKQAPEVVLHVDHIEPVSKGGTNDLLNLITACESCNLGKSDRQLDDHSAVAKKRGQLEALQERKEQLELMMEWQKELLNLDRAAETEAADFWAQLVPPHKLNDAGIQELSKLLHDKFSLPEVLDAMRISVRQYLEYEGEKPTIESVNKAWAYVSKICNVKRNEQKKPYLRDILYIRGIVRNKFTYCNDQRALDLIEETHLAGAPIDLIRETTKRSRNWSEWQADMHELQKDNQ
jgi:HNH endonuclease